MDCNTVAVLEDDVYNLTAKVKNSKGFNELKMYANTGGVDYKFAIEEENASWTSIRISDILVKNGKITIGFFANGTANAVCLVDDVTLVKNKRFIFYITAKFENLNKSAIICFIRLICVPLICDLF